MSPLPPVIVSNEDDDADECDICGKNGADGQARGLQVGQSSNPEMK